MDYKLVAVDMDGTLLTPNLEISKETIETVRKSIDKGIIFTLSTGRMYLIYLKWVDAFYPFLFSTFVINHKFIKIII